MLALYSICLDLHSLPHIDLCWGMWTRAYPSRTLGPMLVPFSSRLPSILVTPYFPTSSLQLLGYGRTTECLHLLVLHTELHDLEELFEAVDMFDDVTCDIATPADPHAVGVAMLLGESEDEELQERRISSRRRSRSRSRKS